MKNSGSKEKILRKIRTALSQKTVQPFNNIDNQNSVYPIHHEGLEMQFASTFSELGGKFVFCEDQAEFIDSFNALIKEKSWSKIVCWDDNLNRLFANKAINGITSNHVIDQIENCHAGITTCEALVARTGTIVLSSALESGRALGIFAPIHIVVAFSSQLVFDLKDAIKSMQSKYPEGLPSLINFATGPSRTADIEKTLVVGVHGPKEVYVFFIDESV
jgi:L-lactate dehydrogenase complex protein LldG